MNKERNWGIALGASLIVNVFCLSALLTGWLAPPPPMHGGGPPPPPEARILFEEIAPHRQPGFRQSMDAIHQQRQAVGRAFAAEPFNAEQLAGALAALRHAESAGAELAHQRIVAAAATLTSDERRQLEPFVGHRPGKPPGPRPPR